MSDPVLCFRDEDKAVPILTSLTVQERKGQEKKPARPSWDRWSADVPLVLEQAGLQYIPAEMGLVVVEEHRLSLSSWLQLINHTDKSPMHEVKLCFPLMVWGNDPELVTKEADI